MYKIMMYILKSVHKYMFALILYILFFIAFPAKAGQAEDELTRIRQVTYLISYTVRSTRYIADIDNRWSHPEETRSRRAGDCEDLAFLLWYDLIVFGVPPEDLTIVFGVRAGVGHAALNYLGSYIDFDGVHDTYPEFIPTSVFRSKQLKVIVPALRGNKGLR